MKNTEIERDIVLEVLDLSLNFGGLWAVKDLDLQLNQGRITGLIGPNGSGKSTLLNMISGFHKPVSGSIVFRGTHIQGVPPYQICKLGISRSFQIPQLFGEVSVLENVMVGWHSRTRVGKLRSCLGLPSARKEDKQAKELALQALEQVGLGKSAEEEAGGLPFGKRRLLEIARAIVSEPRLLLLDEPIGGLSPTETNEICEVIVSLREQGLTILLVEHNMSVIMAISEHLVVMSDGEKIFEGSPQAAQNDDKVVEVYLGSRWKKIASS